MENLLENTASVKGKLREKVEGAVEDIKMAKFLATIRTDVPVELDLEQLRLKEPDANKLQEIFAELEFKSFASRVLNNKRWRIGSFRSSTNLLMLQPKPMA